MNLSSSQAHRHLTVMVLTHFVAAFTRVAGQAAINDLEQACRRFGTSSDIAEEHLPALGDGF